MKKIFLTIVMLLGIGGPALADCVGQFTSAQQVCGNNTGSQSEPQGVTTTSILDAAFGSTRGSIIERGASAWGALPPGTSGFPLISNGPGADPSYKLTGATGGVNLYAAPAGTDTNNDCSNPGTPCTLKGACTVRAQYLTSNAGVFIISLADGTYSSTDGFGALCSVEGNTAGGSSALTFVTGNCSTPTNVVLAIPNSSVGIFTKDAGEAVVTCLEMTAGTSAIGISGAQFSIADYGTITWGTWGAGGIHVSVSTNASITMTGPETVLSTSGTAAHWSVGLGANFGTSNVTTFTGSATWTSSFLSAQNPAGINLNGWTFVGSTIGPRASLVGPGYMITGGVPCNTAIPGNSNCQLLLGFQDDALDNSTFYGNNVRLKLTAPVTYYASTVGSDSNPCTVGSQCLTAQKLINLLNSIDNGGNNVTLQLADGNFAAGVLCNTPFIGSGTVTLTGNAGTPTNVVLNNGATGSAVSVQNGCQIIVHNMQVKGNGDLVLVAGTGSQVLLSGIDFTATTGGSHIAARASGNARVTGPTTVSGNAQAHETSFNNSVLLDAGNATTFTASVTFSDAFLTGNYNASMKTQGSTYNLGAFTVTGLKYDVQGGAVVFTSGACGTLPGTIAGTTATNGQCL